MNRLAIPLVILAVLGVGLWLYSRPSASSVEVLEPAAPLAAVAPDERVDIAGEADAATRTHAVEVMPTVEQVAPVAAEDVTPLDEGEAELVIRVVSSEQKQPIAGVRLFLHALPPPDPIRATHVQGSLAKLGESPVTDEAGTARFVLPSGASYRVSTLAPDCTGSASAEAHDLQPGERRRIELEDPTRDDAHFFGRLVADEDETPIAGARVERTEFVGAWSPRGQDGQPSGTLLGANTPVEPSVTSDAEGRFDFEYSSLRRGYARISAKGRSLVITDFPRGFTSSEKPLVIRMRRAAGLECRVSDASGADVSDLRLRASTNAYLLGARGSDGFGTKDPTWESSVGVDGRGMLDELPPGVALGVELARAGQVVWRDAGAFELAPGETKSIEVVLGASARLRGRILDQHEKPVAEHEVWLKRAAWQTSVSFQPYEEVDAKSKTDEQGAFVFDQVAEGDWCVGPAPLPSLGGDRGSIEAACHAVAELVHIPAGTSKVEVVIRTQRGLVIRGRLVDPVGKPAGPGSVSAWAGESRSFVNAETEDDGSFALGPLGLGDYQVVGMANPPESHAPSQSILARAGDRDLLLRLRPGGTLPCRVVDRSSGEPCDATLTVFRLGAGPYDMGSGWSTRTQGGNFEMSGQVLGTYSIAARTEDGRHGLVRAFTVVGTRAARPVDIPVEPGASLRIRHAGPKGVVRYQVLSDEVCLAFDAVAADQVQKLTVPAGELVIRALHGPDKPPVDQMLTLAKGETREVVIQPYK